MINKQNENILKGIFLTLVSVMILSSVYYLNIDIETEKEPENDYLKSDICYYALNGIKSDYHYHLYLNITINSERVEIPMNIGFEKNDNGQTVFLHPIHTYDNSGRVHVETTKNSTAKLGFFFDIWGKEFSEKRILEYSVDAEHRLNMTVNGENVNTFRETTLEPYQFIEINYTKIN